MQCKERGCDREVTHPKTGQCSRCYQRQYLIDNREKIEANRRARKAYFTQQQKNIADDQRKARAEATARPLVQRDFTHGSLMHAPVNKLEGIVNGILSGRNTLQGVRR